VEPTPGFEPGTFSLPRVRPLKCAIRSSLAQTNSELGPQRRREVEKEAVQVAASSH
jgi:hypothetical protein